MYSRAVLKKSRKMEEETSPKIEDDDINIDAEAKNIYLKKPKLVCSQYWRKSYLQKWFT